MSFLIYMLLFSSASSKTVLRMIGPEDVGGAWREIIKRFEEKNPDIKIKYLSGPWSTDERQNMYIRSFLGGDPIEIVYMDVTWTAKFAENGWIIPLDEFFKRIDREDFIESTVEAGVYKGKLYRIPVRADVGVLYYRKDIIQKPPETWEEFLSICERYSKPPEIYCIVFQGMQYEGLTCNFLEYLWGVGGDVIKNGEVLLDRKETVEALSFMKKLIDKNYAPKSVLTFQEQHSLSFFAEGKSIFMRNWPYAWLILNKDNSKLKGKVGIVPMIHKRGFKSAGTLGGWGFGIARGTKDIEAAWKFIEYATSKEAQKILHFRRGGVPSRKSLFRVPDILKKSPHYPQLYRTLLNARARPVHPDYPRISDTIQKHVSAVLTGIEKPEKAAVIMDKSIESVIKGKEENVFIRPFRDFDLYIVIKNTLVFTLISVPVELILGFFIALLLNQKFNLTGFGKLSVLVPWALPTAVMAMSWQWMFNNPFGVINDFLVRIGLISRPLDWLSIPEGAMFVAIFADIWKTTPFVVIILLAGLQSVPKELRDSIRIDGAGYIREFLYVVLPLLMPFIRVALIFRLLQAFGVFDLIYVLTKGGPADSTKVIALYIYDLAFRYDDTGYAMFLTVLFTALCLLFIFLVTRITTLEYERLK